MIISEAIKIIRLKLNMTQEDLARAISTTSATVNRWENNKVKPNRMATTVLVNFFEENEIEKDLIDVIRRR